MTDLCENCEHRGILYKCIENNPDCHVRESWVVKAYQKNSRMNNETIHWLIVGMQAAVLDAYHNTPGHGMTWIYNALEGPGNLPDLKDEWAGDANDYANYNSKHFNDKYCRICGHPAGGGKRESLSCYRHFGLIQCKHMWE